MIDAARRAHIRDLFYVAHWRVGAIAAKLRVHCHTVYKVLASDGWGSAGPPVQPTRPDRATGLVGSTLEPPPCDPQAREVAP